ncbi:hypothetical protein ACFE04_027957 [Oxalis oulophora]
METATLLLITFFTLLAPSCATADDVTTFVKGVNFDRPAVDVTPFPLRTTTAAKETILCERVQVSGRSRLELSNYANAMRVTLSPSAVIPERLHRKILVCFHRNASLGLCQCDSDDWETIQKGIWNSVMSPYDIRYIDVKFGGELSGSVSVAIEEDFHRWRLLCLAVGFCLLLLAPIISSWVPFYYSSSMAIGVFLVVIIILFQVGLFLLVGVILAGAALGYWIVRKFVISKDGSVDAGIAQFVKWSMRIVASTFIFQSTLDTPLAMGALVSCSALCYLITSPKWFSKAQHSNLKKGSLWVHRTPQTTKKHNRAEFLSKSPKMGPSGRVWNSPKQSPTMFNSPVRGVILPSPGDAISEQDYYSTFHKTGSRKKFTKKEWEEFSRESTRQAIADLTTTPEFTDFLIKHADRIKLVQSDGEVESSQSESDSTDEGSGNGFWLFNW